MWIFSRYGFFSVVQDTRDPRCVNLRARIKEDLEKLTAFARDRLHVELPEIITTTDSDYAHRCVFPKPIWHDLAAALAKDIDYPNFKNETHGERDRDEAYLKIWSTMHALQQHRRSN